MVVFVLAAQAVSQSLEYKMIVISGNIDYLAAVKTAVFCTASLSCFFKSWLKSDDKSDKCERLILLRKRYLVFCQNKLVKTTSNLAVKLLLIGHDFL